MRRTYGAAEEGKVWQFGEVVVDEVHERPHVNVVFIGIMMRLLINFSSLLICSVRMADSCLYC